MIEYSSAPRSSSAQRRRLRGGGGDNDRILERAAVLERLDELRDAGALLPDRDVDAVELFGLVVARVDFFLIEDGVERDRGLAGLAVADDQLALAAADRDQAVDRLEAGLHRLVYRAARDDARRLDLDPGAFGALDRALAVDRIAKRVDDPAQQALADRHVDDRAGALDDVAFLDVAVLAEQHDADVVVLEIERHAHEPAGEFHQLARLDVV
jgi:hypothetical protein